MILCKYVHAMDGESTLLAVDENDALDELKYKYGDALLGVQAVSVQAEENGEFTSIWWE